LSRTLGATAPSYRSSRCSELSLRVIVLNLRSKTLLRIVAPVVIALVFSGNFYKIPHYPRLVNNFFYFFLLVI